MKNPVRRPTLFLTELILNVVILAVCAVVCACLLVKARGMSRDARELTAAVQIAESAAARGGTQADGTRADGCDVAVRVLENGDREITVSREGRALYTLITGGDRDG